MNICVQCTSNLVADLCNEYFHELKHEVKLNKFIKKNINLSLLTID